MVGLPGAGEGRRRGRERGMKQPIETDGAATYAHLAAAAARGQAPSDYEIATSRLHYYVGRGFEVAVPLGEWYRRYQAASPLACDDWDRFVDPRQTTYASYVALQQ